MSESALTPYEPDREIQPRHRIDHRTERALYFMVFVGMTRPEAAAKAGITDNGLYKALRKPDVKRLHAAMCEDLRLSQMPRNLHVAMDIRDNGSNEMARIASIKYLSQSHEQLSTGQATAPGVVINVLEDKTKDITISGGPDKDEP